MKSTPTSNRAKRRAPTGVCYLSPVKSTTSEYFTQSDKSGDHDDVTEIQVTEGEVVVVEDKENECGGEGNSTTRSSGAAPDSIEVPLQSESPLRVQTESSAKCVGSEATPPVLVTPASRGAVLLSPVIRPVSASRTDRFYGARPHRPWSARHTVRSVVSGEEVGGGREGGSPAVAESQGEVRRSLPSAVMQPAWATRLSQQYGVVVEGLTPVKTAQEGKREGRRRKRKEGGEERSRKRGQADPHASLQADLVRLVSEMPELPKVSSSPAPLPLTSCDCHMTSTITGIRASSCCPNLIHKPIEQAIDTILGVL